MQRFRLFEYGLAVCAVFAGAPALAQSWTVDDPGNDGGASAHICPIGEDGSDDYLCFRLECAALQPLHFTLDIAGAEASGDRLPVGVGVDGGDVGVLDFTPHDGDGYTHFTASFDPRDHEELVDLLERGRRASLTLNWPGGPQEVEVGLTGSSDSLYTVMQTCPMPIPPVDDPARLVLDEVTAACEDLGGEVTMEPGFERREDLDGDGREDLVIDYAAAACSQAATLNCGSGGCTVGFFLARDDSYARMFADVIRGYEIFPGGFLALDLHGSACGLYGFEACRKVFDIAGDAPVLVEELAGPGAEEMTVATVTPADAPEVTETGEVEPVVVAVSDGVQVEPEGEVDAAPVAVAEAPAVEPDPVATTAPAEDAAATPVEAVVQEPVVVSVPEAQGTSEEAPVTVAVAEEAVPVEPPAMPDPVAETGEAETAPVVVAAATTPEPGAAGATGGDMAVADPEDDGPTSRHLAGPAPALPADAKFHGDGTLIRPETELQ